VEIEELELHSQNAIESAGSITPSQSESASDALPLASASEALPQLRTCERSLQRWPFLLSTHAYPEMLGSLGFAHTQPPAGTSPRVSHSPEPAQAKQFGFDFETADTGRDVGSGSADAAEAGRSPAAAGLGAYVTLEKEGRTFLSSRLVAPSS
jgi:hypothetical protein